MQTSPLLDDHAAAYQPGFVHYEENLIVHQAYGEQIAAVIREKSVRRVLSLGIGHQAVAAAILPTLGPMGLQRYTLVDASSAILQRFRAEHSPLPQGLELVEAFFEQFRPDEPYELIEAGFVLEHVDDPELLLRRIHEFLLPGGRVFLAVPNARSLHRLIGQAAGLLDDVYSLSEADRALGHQRYYDLPALRKQVEAAGLRVEREQGLLLKPFTTAQLNRLGLAPAVWTALQQVAAPLPELSNAFLVEASR
ncbi:MAG: class I SAM-dependent methyltransferase [Roseateles asaccharophilus]|uniref:class I SAM-dependent methyltransferase n=1 Tax=Roseateles asaccharophilus TaxID=582607 RepID=UPI00391B6D77